MSRDNKPKFLEEGDVIVLTQDHKVYADIPEHFVYNNKRGSFALTHAGIKLTGDFDYLQGKYIVYKVAEEGGGTGHRPHDVYPDGHHVYCEKVDYPDVKVDFYQSGCFSAMTPDITPIGRATRKWIYNALK